MAKKYHPDTNKNNKDAEEKFKDVSEAYEILGDSNKRQEYDTYGTANNNMHSQPGAGGFGSQFHSRSSAEEMFRRIFKDSFSGFDFGMENQSGIT